MIKIRVPRKVCSSLRTVLESGSEIEVTKLPSGGYHVEAWTPEQKDYRSWLVDPVRGYWQVWGKQAVFPPDLSVFHNVNTVPGVHYRPERLSDFMELVRYTYNFEHLREDNHA